MGDYKELQRRARDSKRPRNARPIYDAQRPAIALKVDGRVVGYAPRRDARPIRKPTKD